MYQLPIAAAIAKEATARQALSAAPDAPVVPDTETAPATPRLARVRLSVATGLRRTAGLIEPAECGQAR